MIRLPRLTTFRARLTLRWTLAVGVLLGMANLVVYGGARLYLDRWLDRHVRTVAATEAASSTDGLGDVHLHEAPFGQLQGGAFTEKFVQIFNGDGRLVLQSTALGSQPPLVEPGVIAEALAGRAPVVSVSVEGRPARAAVLRAERDGRPFAVAVGLFAEDIEQGLAFLAWMLGAVWLAGLAATAAIGYGLASRALAPVARITERAAWIARGNFAARLDQPRVLDEVGRMTVLLNSMLDRLQAAVEANRRFASDASHELRGPLTAMAGELDVALRFPRSADSYEETLRHVRGRLGALTTLAEDLILLVRAQEGTREVTLREVALAPLVDEAFHRLDASARARSVTLRHEGLDGIQVYADPSLFARVIDNVLANAVHYNRENGWVQVTARVEEPSTGAWAPPIVHILVQDTGTGIQPDQHERIFERFYRLDQSRARHTGGSGLGLAICREVLTLHGGTIEVAASSPAGTTVEIRIPGQGADVVDEVSDRVASTQSPAAM
ncbi:MAG: HAMP domain-containing protein [Acidobacteria bacterium]|nr:HAMP domain-containing protein [Acidobacteriota bacterium]